MSWRDPDHLPLPLYPCGNSPDIALDDDSCIDCGGECIDRDVLEARGITIDCPSCKGTGVQP